MNAVMESFEKDALSPVKRDLSEKLSVLNQCFDSKVKPENGVYGVTETIKENGIVERLHIDELGHKVKDYLENGCLEKTEVLGDGYTWKIEYDDNGVDYLKTVSKLANNSVKIKDYVLKPNIEIIKGNFSSVIDEFGRPIRNKVTDLSVRPLGEARKTIGLEKDSSYRSNDQRGHIIADGLGGPATRENIVPQVSNVNLSKMARLENIVRQLKDEGHTVDYEVETKYVGSKTMRPSSFEPKITVDGKEYTELPDELKKIYNDASDSAISRTVTNLGEKFGIANEKGIESGLVAAGITLITSSVDNISSYIDGKITAEEMVADIVEDTAIAGAVGYGTAFISTAVSQTLKASSNQLISNIGKSSLPAAAVSFCVQSCDDIIDFAEGKIDGLELAFNLGENAATISGSLAGAKLGAMVGTVAGPAGTVIGSVVGGTIGCVVASGIYETAVEYGEKAVDVIADKAVEYANQTVEAVSAFVPEAVESVKSAFGSFLGSVGISF